MKILGTVLRSTRKALNLSIQEVADKLNVAYGTAANMEAGGKNPTLTQLDDYGLIFGYSTGLELVDIALDISKDIHMKSNDKLKEFSAKEIDEYMTKEKDELIAYGDMIMNEFVERQENENFKMNIEIDSAIKVILMRHTDKGARPVDQRELENVRNEAIEIITMRLKHLLY